MVLCWPFKIQVEHLVLTSFQGSFKCLLPERPKVEYTAVESQSAPSNSTKFKILEKKKLHIL